MDHARDLRSCEVRARRNAGALHQLLAWQLPEISRHLEYQRRGRRPRLCGVCSIVPCCRLFAFRLAVLRSSENACFSHRNRIPFHIVDAVKLDGQDLQNGAHVASREYPARGRPFHVRQGGTPMTRTGIGKVTIGGTQSHEQLVRVGFPPHAVHSRSMRNSEACRIYRAHAQQPPLTGGSLSTKRLRPPRIMCRRYAGLAANRSRPRTLLR